MKRAACSSRNEKLITCSILTSSFAFISQRLMFGYMGSDAS